MNESTVPEERQEEERGCFCCLDGWVFMGGLNEDGEEEYYALYCRRCSGSGILEPSGIRA